jgi:regulator of CtrA degradation
VDPSTLFDASLFKLKAAIFAAFFLARFLLFTFVLTKPGDFSMIITGNFRKLRKGLLNMRENSLRNGAVDFLARFTDSEQFEKTFREGMGLVEETANYLDGEGRVDARLLDRTGAIAYATESMRLTTRLMQLASWLLLQRAIAKGEMTSSETQQEKHRINLNEIGRGHELKGAEQMPEGLKLLVDRSLRLLERIKTLDAMLDSSASPATEESPISAQLNRLERAFRVG